jgi:hypothetical protein
MGSYQEFCQTTMQETIWCMRCPHCRKRWGGAFCEAWISEQVFQPAQPAPARLATQPFCHRCDGTIKEPSISFHPKCLADYVEGQQIASSVQSYRGLAFHPSDFTFGCADLETMVAEQDASAQPAPAGQELREDPLEHVRKILDSDNDWEDRQAAVYSYLDLQRLATPDTLRERLEGDNVRDCLAWHDPDTIDYETSARRLNDLLASAPAPAATPQATTPIPFSWPGAEFPTMSGIEGPATQATAQLNTFLTQQPASPVGARARYEEWRNSRWAGLGYVRNLDNDLWDGWQAAERAAMERGREQVLNYLSEGLAQNIREALKSSDAALATSTATAQREQK